jgi:uncharacterized protein YdhG (YjbR/CyaY superfamily)
VIGANLRTITPHRVGAQRFRDDTAAYETSKGSLKFAIAKPSPSDWLKKLISARMRELGLAA